MRGLLHPLYAALLAAPLVLVIIVPTAGAASQPAPVASPFPAALQKQLTKALDSSFGKTVSPGAIVGVWVDGRGWTATRGTGRKGAKLKPSLEDRTRIGSLTKTFAATLILQLADEGKLKLTDTLDKWFPWVPNASQITIRDLGDMGSGINIYTATSHSYRCFAAPEAAWKPIEVIQDGVSLPPKFAPGQIAEKVTGEPIGKLLDHPRRHRPRLQHRLRLSAEAESHDRRPHQHRHRARLRRPPAPAIMSALSGVIASPDDASTP